jgi:hypothetical protein
MPTLHTLAVCRECLSPIEYDPVFAPPCGQHLRQDDHARCASNVWHGHCLMVWRERIEKIQTDLVDATLVALEDIPDPVLAILRSLGLI